MCATFHPIPGCKEQNICQFMCPRSALTLQGSKTVTPYQHVWWVFFLLSLSPSSLPISCHSKVQRNRHTPPPQILYFIFPFFPLHLTLNMKHEHASISLIIRHLYASHHCCVSSWLGGSQLDAQHTRALAYLRLPQPLPNSGACLWECLGWGKVSWLHWWGVQYASCLPQVSVACRRLCQGRAGCWVPQSASVGHRYFAADPVGVCNSVIHKKLIN